MDPDNTGLKCTHCGDLGWVSFLVPVGHPRFGRAAPCPHCALGQSHLNRSADQLLKRAGLPESYRALSLETFAALPEAQLQGKRLALSTVWALAHQYEQGVSLRAVVEMQEKADADTYPDRYSNWLMLYGGLGLGKTGLAAAFINEIAPQGVTALFYRLQELFAEIQSHYGEGGAADDLQARICRASVLVLDECTIPTDSSGAASVDKRRILEEICRFRHARRLPTLFTGNLDQPAFTRMWGERTASVVCEGHWVELLGVPLRARAHTVKSF